MADFGLVVIPYLCTAALVPLCLVRGWDLVRSLVRS